jgi:hypothetical protein
MLRGASTTGARARAGGNDCPAARHRLALLRSRARPSASPLTTTIRAAAASQQQSSSEQAQLAPRREGKRISTVEVPAFIMRDDMMDQLYRWALVSAGEAAVRNFGLPMSVAPRYRAAGGAGDSDMTGSLWGFEVEVLRDGARVADLGVNFDDDCAVRSEWIGQDADGFPRAEGRQEQVAGKNLEVWFLSDEKLTDEDLRAAIRAFCAGLVSAVNRFYSFGSVFAEDI